MNNAYLFNSDENSWMKSENFALFLREGGGPFHHIKLTLLNEKSQMHSSEENSIQDDN